eukprot:4666324-Heterocapsa_arctica.AAC.1
MPDLDSDPQANSTEGMSNKEAQGKPQGLPTPYLMQDYSCDNGIDNSAKVRTSPGTTASEQDGLPRRYHCSVDHKEQFQSCRIGEAGNPGPGEDKQQFTHMKMVDFFGGMHILKDERAEWCREKGLSIQRIRGDGNSIYTCLGKNMELDGD